jgi:hypothetical protein
VQNIWTKFQSFSKETEIGDKSTSIKISATTSNELPKQLKSLSTAAQQKLVEKFRKWSKLLKIFNYKTL